MDHPTYLEQHHEYVTKVLPEIDLRYARGDHEDAANITKLLRAKLDDLWKQRVAEAERGVAP